MSRRDMTLEYEVIDRRGVRIMAGDSLKVHLPAWHCQAEDMNGRMVKARRFVTGRGGSSSGTIGVTSHDPVWNEFNRGIVYPGSWFEVVA